MHYRVDYAKDAGNAHSACYWACNTVKSNYSSGFLETCKQGCDRAHGQDTK